MSFSLKLNVLGVSSWMEQPNFFLPQLNLGFILFHLRFILHIQKTLKSSVR